MHFLIGLAIIVVLLALFPRAMALVVGSGILLLTIIVIAMINGGNSQKAAQQQSVAAMEKARAEQNVRDAEDLKRCGPPDPDWSSVELWHLSVCEAAMKPPIVPDSNAFDNSCNESARSCLLHKRLREEHNRREEAERRTKAEKARREWLASPEGRNRSGAVQRSTQSLELRITAKTPVPVWVAAKRENKKPTIPPEVSTEK